MKLIHFIFIALPVAIILDISSFIADYLEDRWGQHTGWWNNQNEGIGRLKK